MVESQKSPKLLLKVRPVLFHLLNDRSRITLKYCFVLELTDVGHTPGIKLCLPRSDPLGEIIHCLGKSRCILDLVVSDPCQINDHGIHRSKLRLHIALVCIHHLKVIVHSYGSDLYQFAGQLVLASPLLFYFIHFQIYHDMLHFLTPYILL